MASFQAETYNREQRIVACDEIDEDTEISQRVSDAYKDMKNAYEHAGSAHTSKPAELLDRAGDLYNSAVSNLTTVRGVVTVVEPAYESEAMKTVRNGITAFVEGLPRVLDALDTVAKLHPFIAVAVEAFRVVVELDMRRRDNERKITVLFMEMKDMMEVLAQLRSIKDEATVGPDGLTIEARLQELVKRTADDIKACANVCDAYAKKKLLVKVLKSSSWDEKLKGYLTLFADRRKAFAFALEIHIGKGVDDANRKLEAVDVKLSMILEVFTALVPMEQRQLSELVQRRGGPEAVARDDDTLIELLKSSLPSPSAPTKRDTDLRVDSSGKDGSRSEILRRDELDMLKEELFDSTDAAIKKNLEAFESKFSMQQRRLFEEMQGVVRHESDRVIDTVLSGPHDRIKDRDIHEIWKDMNWRGHVKARHFILALRDFYLQVFDEASVTAIPHMSPEERWTLEYVDVKYIQALAEAFDDDASGFITISEVNRFTSIRPPGWSLPQWLAYWAIGWQLTTSYYINRIKLKFAYMFALLPHIRPENQPLVYDYLRAVWKPIAAYMMGFDSIDVDESELWPRFQSYADAEERRLHDNLRLFHYRIDGADTVSLITGPGRIEMFLLPLFYLLLSRDLQIIHVSLRKVIISPRELADSTDSIFNVVWAAQRRTRALEALCKQRNLDPDAEFRTFACGLYNYIYQWTECWQLKRLMNVGIVRAQYIADDWVSESTAPDFRDVLTHPTPHEGLFNMMSPETFSQDDLHEENPDIKAILGRWYGFFGESVKWPGYPMVTFFLHTPLPEDGFMGKSATPEGDSYVVMRQGIQKCDDGVTYRLAMHIRGAWISRYMKGKLSEDGLSMSGTWGYTPDALEHEFYFTRLSPEVLAARPSPQEFRENRIRALWRFALAASRSQVRRRLSWRYLHDFTRRRRTYIDLAQRDMGGIELSEDEARTMMVLQKELTYDEACCCYFAVQMRQRTCSTSMFHICDVCGVEIQGARYTCISCTLERGDSVDFCDKPGCRDTALWVGDVVHKPSHDMIKIRGPILQERDLPWLFRSANNILRRLAETPGFQSDDEGAPYPAVAGKFTSDRDAASTAPDANATENARGESGGRTEGLQRRMTKRASSGPTCVSCSETVRLPFFVCLDCIDFKDVPPITYICTDCDERFGGVSSGAHHYPSHSLVRCVAPEDAGDSIDEGQGPPSIEERLRTLETLYSEKFSTLDDRIAKIERLLQNVLVALGKPTTEVSQVQDG